MTDRNFTKSDGVSLKDYFEARLSAIETATVVATTALDRRLGGMNEFREAMKDQAAQMVTRSELNVRFERIDEELESLRTYRDRMEGKASQTSVIVSLVFGIAGLIFGIINLLT